ncbi:MAG: NAD(P)H-hydrate dehydratase, partial [Pseudomonadota bacterium]
ILNPKNVKELSAPAGGWDFVVDALFGTGLERPLKSPHSDVVNRINSLRRPVYAVDLPSGLHTDTGAVLGTAVQATVTVTLGFKKRGFFVGDGPGLAGDLLVADLSLDEAWADQVKALRLFETQREDVTGILPPRERTGHKGSYGHVLIVAGSPGKSGAAVLAARSALRGGSGLVTLAVPESAHDIVKKQVVEVMTLKLPDDGNGKLGPSALPALRAALSGKTVLLAGPGLIPHPGLTKLLSSLLKETDLPVVLDADGLNTFGTGICREKKALGRSILTPHPGEMARLTGSTTAGVQRDRIEVAARLADRLDAVVILKGAFSVVALPSGETWLNPTGNPAMATAGMGDVLTGLLGALLAQGISREKAAVAGTFFHGLAGDRVAAAKGPRGILAGDLIEELPRVLA